MRTAVRSTAIVSSLFPSNVRDKLFPEAEPEAAPISKKLAFAREAKREDGVVEEVSEKQPLISNGPIADLYPETTVLFADIAGKCVNEKMLAACMIARRMLTQMPLLALFSQGLQHGAQLEVQPRCLRSWKHSTVPLMS